MDILTKLGVDWRIFIAQLVNFAILLFLLHHFLYRPLLAFLDKRKALIEKSVEQAREIERCLAETATERDRVLATARASAQEIIANAQKKAEENITFIERVGHERMMKEREHARAELIKEKDQMLISAHTHFADLVARAVERVLTDHAPHSISSSLIASSLKTFEDKKI